ncbi:protein FAM124A-like [Megalops cyprinoides]|uniref:protein FAM124A-like n=1 Tax=Megalops cyprinoides TaxID=118141 RepID=UPI001863F994|nr:protein FAM124A-like [Megalops cyprinoides]
MSLSSEMEKNSTEDDCADSGAETAGSDYSPMSSASSELSMADLQDPFLVSVHIITDPGQAKPLQRAADAVLAWIHPELQLFRVSERGAWQRRPKQAPSPSSGQQRAPASQPALAVILFLQEEYAGEEQVLRLHRALRRPPWRYHHTELVNGRLLPLAPCSQDFYTLAPGTPLWAVRQVHYGKEIVRFTVYCRHHSYADMVDMYRLLLRRQLAQRKEDFCFFVVYSNPDTEIQLSFKRLPRGQEPTPTESAIMEFRVRDVGALVPLLPRPCTPISEVRWQTEDYDGNKILLQVRGSAHCRRRHTIAQLPRLLPDSSSLPSPPPPEHAPVPSYGRGPASYRNRRYHRNSSRARHQNQARVSQPDLPLACDRDPEALRACWTGHRSRSLFCLPSLSGARSAPCSPSLASSTLSRRSSPAPPFRLNVDALVGAEETDVDTGRKMDSGAVDLSVVSAYARPRTPHSRPRPVSMPPREPVLCFSGLLCGSSPAVDRRRRSCHSTSSTPSILRRPRPHSACLPVPVWDSEQGTEAEEYNDIASKDLPVEEEQEFYI